MMRVTVEDNSDEIIRRLEAIETQEITIGDLLTADFLKEHAGLDSLDELLRVAGVSDDSVASLEDLDTDKLRDFLRERTRFASLEEMIQAAAEIRLAADFRDALS